MEKVETNSWKLNHVFRRIRELIISVRWIYLWTGIGTGAWAVWLLWARTGGSVCLGLVLMCVSVLNFAGYWKVFENPRPWMYLLAGLFTLCVAGGVVLDIADETNRMDDPLEFVPKFIQLVWVVCLWKLIPAREAVELIDEHRSEWRAFLSRQGKPYRIKKRIGSRTSRSGKSSGRLRDIGTYLEALFKADGPDSFLIVSIPKSGEFLQFLHAGGELCVDFPLVTGRQRALNANVRRAFGERGLKIVDVNGTDVSEAVQGWGGFPVEEGTSLIIGLFSDIYGISENEEVTFEWNEMDMAAQPPAEDGS